MLQSYFFCFFYYLFIKDYCEFKKKCIITSNNLVIREGDMFYHWDREVYYVVSLFEHCGETYVIIKTWNNYKNKWIYSVEDLDTMQWWLTNEHHKQAKEYKGKLYINANREVL